MNIIWYGQSCFKIAVQRPKVKEKVSLVIDPYSASTGMRLGKMEGDVFLFTHEHDDHNNRDVVGKEAFVIDSPGEYEVKDIFVQGIFSYHDEVQGRERGSNTIYILDAEGMRICHLGDFGEEELSDKQLKEIGDVDILMIPVGGGYTVDAKKATKIISQVEPRIVVPMHYAIDGLKIELEELDVFLKAIGEKSAEKLDKLTLQKKDLPEEDMKIIPLISQGQKA